MKSPIRKAVACGILITGAVIELDPKILPPDSQPTPKQECLAVGLPTTTAEAKLA